MHVCAHVCTDTVCDERSSHFRWGSELGVETGGTYALLFGKEKGVDSLVP